MLCRWAFGCWPVHLSCGECSVLSANCNMLSITAVFSLSVEISAQCHVALLRVLNCCPTCTMKLRITAATRTILSYCHYWRAAVDLTQGQFLCASCRPCSDLMLTCVPSDHLKHTQDALKISSVSIQLELVWATCNHIPLVISKHMLPGLTLSLSVR